MRSAFCALLLSFNVLSFSAVNSIFNMSGEADTNQSPWGKGVSGPADAVLWKYFTNEVRQTLGNFTGIASIVFYDFKTGNTISINPDEPYYPACLIKFPFMVACMQAVYEGRISLYDKLELKAEDYVEGSGILLHDPIGSNYTVHNLLDTMIQYSDNIALNILIDGIGLDYPNANFTNYGITNTKLYHKVMYYGTLTMDNLTNLGQIDAQLLWQDLVSNNYIFPFGNIKENFFDLSSPDKMILDKQFEGVREPLFKMMHNAYHANGYNQMTAGDTALLFKEIYLGQIVNARVSKACLRLLEENLLNDRIPAGLPEGVMVAHKTGSTTRVCHDAGIVFTPKGDFIICIMTRDAKGGYEDARQFIRNIAVLAYNYRMGIPIPPYQ